jgi:hypothetical protein
LKDPRASDPDQPVPDCDPAKLNAAPSSPESALKAYLEASSELKTQAAAASAALLALCNQVDGELNLQTGQDVVAACKALNQRVAQLNSGPPPPPGYAAFAEIRYLPDCTTPPDALAQCVATCSAAGCDSSKCDPSSTSGKCDGNCTGTCITTGDNLACNGECAGEIPLPNAPSDCTGECVGSCTGPTWYAQCDGACGSQFFGNCGGTCTGKCNGNDINVTAIPPPPDGGPPGPPGPPPKNADGNCQGLCTGMCSSKSNGACDGTPCFNWPAAGPPTPANYTGVCLDRCGGKCRAALGSGSATSCSGSCTQRVDKAKCDGVCTGTCDGTRSATTCSGTINCGQNDECSNACGALVALKATCGEPKLVEAYATTDDPLYQAWLKHGPAFGKIVTQLTYLRQALGFIGNRAYGDFVAIGLRGSLIRKCVDLGNASIADAQTNVTNSFTADPTTRKVQ